MKEQRTQDGMKKKLNYIQDYNKRMYDRAELKLPRGEKARYRAAADSLGLSFNALVITAVEEYVSKNL